MDLERHIGLKQKFKAIISLENNQKTLDAIIIKENEVKLAAFIALHSSIAPVHHWNNLMVKHSKTEFGNMKLHKFKCTLIIKNVIAETLKEQLLKEIGSSYYSLVRD